MTDPTPLWHTVPPEEALLRLASTAAGLSATEAAKRSAAHGPNRLPAARSAPWWHLAWRQIHNPISWVLVAAGALALLLQQGTDALVVFGAVVVNGAIGFLQEWRAGRAIASLSAMVAETATVLREGRPATVPTADLVPGDVVALSSGDRVPADLRILEAASLFADESALTGESVPVAKQVAAVAADAPLGDRLCLLFGGTHVTQGAGRGVVIRTGANTELGRINTLLQRTDALATPLTRQLAVVGRWITVGVVALATAMFVYNTWGKGGRLGESAFTAVTLAVAAIPEGLPAILTIALAIGVRRMAARRAVVRQLPAVETLGSTSAICSDKTGTLTRNEMTVQALWCNGDEYRLTGVGYAPDGTLQHNGERLATAPAAVRELLRGGCLCNDAGLSRGPEFGIVGDPTEAALLVAARKVGLDEAAVRAAHPRRGVVPFESEHRFMATLHTGEHGAEIWLKGAPEVVFARCGLDASQLAQVRGVQEAFAEHGLRVLAIARRQVPTATTGLRMQELGDGFDLQGLVGMLDPPRHEAIDAIRRCHEAGIRVTMITGDHPATAAAVGRALGLGGATALTGNDLDRLDAPGWSRAVDEVRVFARVSPEHKIRLVETMQAAGQVVAMTGDGVNDAPALKRADIGVAMGITGTAVSKAAAKIVLVDDNFATIAAAVEEGRRVYDNLQKALAFLLPTNLGLALVLAAATLFFPTVVVEGIGPELLLPMSPTQILWINLVASVLLSLPVAFEALEPGAMRRPPRARNAPVFSPFVIGRTVVVALLMAAGTCALFAWEFERFTRGLPSPLPATAYRDALAEAQTIAVTTVALIQVCYLLHCRSLRGGLRAMGWLTNPLLWPCVLLLLLLQTNFVYLPPLQAAFGTHPLDFEAWWHALLPGLVVLAAIEVEKRVRRALAR